MFWGTWAKQRDQEKSVGWIDISISLEIMKLKVVKYSVHGTRVDLKQNRLEVSQTFEALKDEA